MSNVSRSVSRRSRRNITLHLVKTLVMIAHNASRNWDQWRMRGKSECCHQDCNGTYRVQANQYLHKRISNHKNTVENSKVETSALAKQLLEKLHHFDYDNFQVLSYESDYHKKAVLELLYNKKDNNFGNYWNNFQNLSKIHQPNELNSLFKKFTSFGINIYACI